MITNGTIWDRLFYDTLAALRPYLPYVVIPLGACAAARVFHYFVPGPHHLPKLCVRSRTVLITGASSGLGRELAIKLYREGAKLILVARGIDDLEELCNELKAMTDVENPNEPVYSYFDMADVNEKSVSSLVSLFPMGKIDILVNNAGVSMRGNCAETPMKVHRQIMETNYFGHIHLTKLLLEHMPEDGTIVVTNSIQGKIAVPYRSAYSASKHATQAFFDSLRCEKGPKFHILSVYAAYMNTGFGRRALDVYGKPVEKDDPNQAQGILPEIAAEKVFNALITRDTELTLAPWTYRIAIFLRWLCPNLLFYILYRRGLKDVSSKKNE